MFIITPRYHVAPDDGLDNVIVVDGVPVIDKSKLDKLLAKISKEFTKKGAALKSENIFVPWDNALGKSKGYPNTIFQTGSIANWPLQLHIRRRGERRRSNIRDQRHAWSSFRLKTYLPCQSVCRYRTICEHG